MLEVVHLYVGELRHALLGHLHLVSELHLALLEFVLSLENIKILELEIEMSQDLFYKVFSWNLI